MPEAFRNEVTDTKAVVLSNENVDSDNIIPKENRKQSLVSTRSLRSLPLWFLHASFRCIPKQRRCQIIHFAAMPAAVLTYATTAGQDSQHQSSHHTTYGSKETARIRRCVGIARKHMRLKNHKPIKTADRKNSQTPIHSLNLRGLKEIYAFAIRCKLDSNIVGYIGRRFQSDVK